MLFPAWAGVILYARCGARRGRAFPRMGGGDPATARCSSLKTCFSPHGRG